MKLSDHPKSERSQSSSDFSKNSKLEIYKKQIGKEFIKNIKKKGQFPFELAESFMSKAHMNNIVRGHINNLTEDEIMTIVKSLKIKIIEDKV